MRYYAATNSYASGTSIGFANSWDVWVFDSERARDAFVSGRDDLATRAITRREVTHYAANYSMPRNEVIKPRPFSGEYWGIVPVDPANNTDGLIGVVQVCYPQDTYPRLYRL